MTPGERKLRDRILEEKIQIRAIDLAQQGRNPWEAGSILDTGEWSGLYARLSRPAKNRSSAWTDGFVTGLKYGKVVQS